MVKRLLSKPQKCFGGNIIPFSELIKIARIFIRWAAWRCCLLLRLQAPFEAGRHPGLGGSHDMDRDEKDLASRFGDVDERVKK